MKTQGVSNYFILPDLVDFPAPGALTSIIMANLLEMASRCQGISRQAEDKGDLKLSLAAIKETHKLLMDLAKLDTARLKAQKTQPEVQTAAPVFDDTPAPTASPSERVGSAQTDRTQADSQVSPAQEPSRPGDNQNPSHTIVSGPGSGEPEPVPPQPLRRELPPNARGVTNLGNFVY